MCLCLYVVVFLHLLLLILFLIVIDDSAKLFIVCSFDTVLKRQKQTCFLSSCVSYLIFSYLFSSLCYIFVCPSLLAFFLFLRNSARLVYSFTQTEEKTHKETCIRTQVELLIVLSFEIEMIAGLLTRINKIHNEIYICYEDDKTIFAALFMFASETLRNCPFFIEIHWLRLFCVS